MDLEFPHFTQAYWSSSLVHLNNAPVQKPLEKCTELAGVKRLGAIQQGDDWAGLVPEEVVGDLHDKPAALGCTGALFIPKLQGVSGH